MPDQLRQPFVVEEAADTVLAEIQQRVRHNGAPVVVGISGIDCSGKTTLARALRSAVRDSFTMEAVAVDDFIIPSGHRRRNGVAHIDYFENTFDHAAFASKVKDRVGSGDVDVVVGEGVFLFRREFIGLWDLKVWIEMDSRESVARGAVRDAEYFGSAGVARSEYEHRFVPAHHHHTERDDPMKQADIVFIVDE